MNVVNYNGHILSLSYPETSNTRYTIQLVVVNSITNEVKINITKTIKRKSFLFFGETLNEFLDRVFKEGGDMLHSEIERLYLEGIMS